MTYKQLEKIREEFESLDLSRYRILTLDEMLKVNGGGSSETDESDEESSSTLDSESFPSEGGSTESASETEDFYVSSHADVANASAGDTITRSDGSTYTVNDKDIEYEQNYCNEHGINWQGEEAEKSPEELQSQDDDGSLESTQSVGENTEINGEKENTQNPNKANSEYLDYVERCRIRDEEAAAKKNAELDCPKGNSVADNIMNVVNTTANYTGVAGELAKEAAKTDLQAAPVLNEFSQTMSKLGETVVFADFAYTSYNNAKSYIDGEQSYWQSAYNTISHGVSVTLGAAVTLGISGAGTFGSFGIGSAPSVIAGVAVGYAATEGCERIFDLIEEKIWGEAK